MDKVKQLKDRVVVRSDGVFSQTLNSFQIGMVAQGQWAGDEIMVLRDDPFPYSVVASTVVEALALSKSDLLTKVPKEIRELIEQKASMKLEWVKKRLVEICLGVETI